MKPGLTSTGIKFLLERGHSLQVTIKNSAVDCDDVQDLCFKNGYVTLYKKGDNYCIDNPEECENVLCVNDWDYVWGILEDVIGASGLTCDEPMYDVDEETEELLEKLFLSLICSKIACGSQRCDRSHEWMDGCKLYKDFKQSVLKKASEIVES